MSIFTSIVGFINKDILLIKCRVAINRKERREAKFEKDKLNRLFKTFNDFKKGNYYEFYLDWFIINCRFVEHHIKPKYYEVNRYYFKNKFKHLKRKD